MHTHTSIYILLKLAEPVLAQDKNDILKHLLLNIHSICFLYKWILSYNFLLKSSCLPHELGMEGSCLWQFYLYFLTNWSFVINFKLKYSGPLWEQWRGPLYPSSISLTFRSFQNTPWGQGSSHVKFHSYLLITLEVCS